jgi:hypothetical protein
VIDAFAVHGASALAAVFCVRSVCGFAFPLFAPKLFATLGTGGGYTLIAGLEVFLGAIASSWLAPACSPSVAIPAGPLIYIYGARLRAASRHAKK